MTAIFALCLFHPVAHADSLGDPMRPANAQASSSAARSVAPKGSRVTAIFASGERRVAVFDGRVVRPGDRVGNAVILDVLADGVRFAQSGRIEIARLPKQSVVVLRERTADSKTVATVSQESEP
jgi:MSHA biogenesis protein MshK